MPPQVPRFKQLTRASKARVLPSVSRALGGVAHMGASVDPELARNVNEARDQFDDAASDGKRGKRAVVFSSEVKQAFEAYRPADEVEGAPAASSLVQRTLEGVRKATLQVTIPLAAETHELPLDGSDATRTVRVRIEEDTTLTLDLVLDSSGADEKLLLQGTQARFVASSSLREGKTPVARGVAIENGLAALGISDASWIGWGVQGMPHPRLEGFSITRDKDDDAVGRMSASIRMGGIPIPEAVTSHVIEALLPALNLDVRALSLGEVWAAPRPVVAAEIEKSAKGTSMAMPGAFPVEEPLLEAPAVALPVPDLHTLLERFHKMSPAATFSLDVKARDDTVAVPFSELSVRFKNGATPRAHVEGKVAIHADGRVELTSDDVTVRAGKLKTTLSRPPAVRGQQQLHALSADARLTPNGVEGKLAALGRLKTSGGKPVRLSVSDAGSPKPGDVEVLLPRDALSDARKFAKTVLVGLGSEVTADVVPDVSFAVDSSYAVGADEAALTDATVSARGTVRNVAFESGDLKAMGAGPMHFDATLDAKSVLARHTGVVIYDNAGSVVDASVGDMHVKTRFGDAQLEASKPATLHVESRLETSPRGDPQDVHTLRVQGTGHGLLGKAKTPLSLKVDRNYRLHHSATAGFELEDKAHSHKLVLRREAKEVAKVSTAEGDAAPRKMKFSRAVRAKLSKLWHKAVP